MERIIAIPGLEDQYSVTDSGRVYSHKSRRFLRSSDNGHGYQYIMLCVDGKPFHKYIHRLVAETFVPNPDNLPEVNHKDENRANNSWNNLEWCTSKYNKNYGGRARKFGISRGKAVHCIETGDVFFSVREAARQFDISASSIAACCTGYRNTQTAGGYHWEYQKPLEGIR